MTCCTEGSMDSMEQGQRMLAIWARVSSQAVPWSMCSMRSSVREVVWAPLALLGPVCWAASLGLLV